jgi:hypothetical protein
MVCASRKAEIGTLFDEAIAPDERAVISHIESQLINTKWCPRLGRQGDYFYYCTVGVNAVDRELHPSFTNSVYQKRVNCGDLQRHCMGNYRTCAYFPKIAPVFELVQPVSSQT